MDNFKSKTQLAIDVGADPSALSVPNHHKFWQRKFPWNNFWRQICQDDLNPDI